MKARGALWAAFALLLLLALLLVWLTWPAPPAEKRVSLEPAAFGDLPGWAADDHAAGLAAFAESCKRIARWPENHAMGGDGIAGTAGDWQPACVALVQVPVGDDAAARRFFETWFRPYAVSFGGSEEGLFTGYYEPLLHASRRRSERFSTPLYRLPDDLVSVDLGAFAEDLKGRQIVGRLQSRRLVPYPDRAAIEDGALAGRGLELYWVDDPVDAFFLQIQGSGRLVLPDGSERRIAYAGKNGQPYFAIGRALIQDGVMPREEVSMQSIRAWLEAHPDQGRALMRRNRAYVFFRALKDDAVIGALGVPLTPGRSLAVDRRLIPLGAPLWLDAMRPGDEPGMPDAPLRRLMVAQDTGGAIRGGVRGDVFWGHGPKAEHLAGHMQHPG
ncbi:MAG TPA: murein transglycosylase A, partial [Alphaproteobacteria bacterium]|nr:murein transglycosylase A [Alphaproteobacteria bacterium]